MKSLLSKIFRSLACMVLIAFFVRILCTAITHSYRFTGLWSSFEMAALARSLATGHGFSAPYGVDTGPSALTPPIYPWLTSLAFRAFGVYSYGAGFAMVVFNSIFSALTCWTIYRIARRVFNETIGLCSGWAWAVWPYAIYYSIGWIWETSLSAFLLSLLFLRTLEMEDDARLSSWFGYGLLWGITALTNTALLAWLPFSGCWLAYQLHRHGKRFVVPVVFSAAVFWITLMPWLVRNYRVFGQPVFIRDNFGNEFRAGNNPRAEGWKVGSFDAARNPHFATVYKQMGELEVNKLQADDAETWIAQNPTRFLVLCVRRFYFFWAGLPRTWAGLPLPPSKKLKNLIFLATSLVAFGGLFLALKKRPRGIFLFATLIFFYPLTYYISNTEPRYRHSIEPQLVIVSVFLLVSVAARLLPRPIAQLAAGEDESAERVLAAHPSGR